MTNPGDLDTSFSGDGRKTVNFRGTDVARAVLVQPNGRIVVAGEGGFASSFCVARLRGNGALDTSFGPGGKRVIDFGGQNESARGAAVQPDGKIVVVGQSDSRVALARLNSNGSLDASFSGDGKRTFSWGPISVAMAVLVLANGKLLLAGFSGPEGGNVQVARLQPNGALDTTFGDGGKAAIDFGGDDFGLAMARQANGRILVAGVSTVAGAIVARLRANGAPDPDFHGDGRLSVGTGRLCAVFVQPQDRRIVVMGNANGNDTMTVTRLKSNGALDMTFAGNGTATIDFAPLVDFAGDAVLQPDGKIVVAGSRQSGGDFAIARLNSDGSPDMTFGTAGKATVDWGVAAFGFAVALQADGKIVVAGQRTGADDFAVARLIG